VRTKVRRWGNSLAVRIPKSFADEVGVSEGAAVEMRLVERGLFVESVSTSGPILDDLLARVTPENLHGGIPLGLPQGLEAWSPVSSVPERGDVVWISMVPQSGREQAGRRAGVVLSPARQDGRVGLALRWPIISVIKGYAFEVAVPSGAGIRGVVLADQVKSLDWRARRAELIAHLPDEASQEILQRLSTLLDD
jgi:mRNA interferase MazF